jgi:hypothetical protein
VVLAEDLKRGRELSIRLWTLKLFIKYMKCKVKYEIQIKYK